MAQLRYCIQEERSKNIYFNGFNEKNYNYDQM